MRHIAPMTTVHGVELDAATRCAHYHAAADVLAIRMACCGAYYACHACHDALAGHAAMPWPSHRHGEIALRCGACTVEFTIRTYLANHEFCPGCGTAFNPGCRTHHHLYFDALS
jgi:uncharacterized CHY-type Zn-finger protein